VGQDHHGDVYADDGELPAADDVGDEVAGGVSRVGLSVVREMGWGPGGCKAVSVWTDGRTDWYAEVVVMSSV
jgi:hypothetical protein